jgi:probable selenium-dependent hydroxylase accessory protein YqeC
LRKDSTDTENKEADCLSALLDISAGSIVSVVGCGGKTSLIGLIAEENKNKKVLVSPTTKVFPILSDEVVLCDTLESSIEHVPKTGIQCLGVLNTRSGKLEALPKYALAALATLYDVVLMEADGSRGLPCKGWLKNEPVVPFFSTHTVGVVSLCALGKQATKEFVHHLPEFLSLTGLKEGDIITEQAIEDMLCAPLGMIKNSIGKNYLVINKVEDEHTEKHALIILKNIKTKHPKLFCKIIYGSVHGKTWGPSPCLMHGKTWGPSPCLSLFKYV